MTLKLLELITKLTLTLLPPLGATQTAPAAGRRLYYYSGKFICTEMNPRHEKEPPCTFCLFFACNCILPFWNEVGSQMMVKTSNLKDNKSSVHKHVTHIHIAQHVHIHEQLFNPRRCSESVCEDPPDFTTGLAAFAPPQVLRGSLGGCFWGGCRLERRTAG